MSLKLKERMKKLTNETENFVSELISSIEKLEQENILLNKKVSLMETENNFNNGIITKLKKENNELKEESELINKEVIYLKNKLEERKRVILSFENDKNLLNNKEIISNAIGDGNIVKSTEKEDGEECVKDKYDIIGSIKEAIKNNKEYEADDILRKKIKKLANSKEQLKEEDKILLSYLAFNNTMLDILEKNSQIKDFMNGNSREAFALNLLIKEQKISFNEPLDECFQSYFEKEKRLFFNIEYKIKEYLKDMCNSISCKYFEKYSVLEEYENKNYRKIKGFVKVKGKYYLVDVLNLIRNSKDNMNYVHIDSLKCVQKEEGSFVKNELVEKKIVKRYNEIIVLYEDNANKDRIKEKIELLLDDSNEISRLTKSKKNSILFIGNLVGVNKFKMDRVMKLNSMEQSLELSAYRKLSGINGGYEYLRQNMTKLTRLDERIRIKLLSELIELQRERERLGSKFFELRSNEQSKIQIELSKESPIKKLGYSTNLGDKERWDILFRKAIPTLGEKKVAYHLRMLIKMNKHRKNRQNAVEKWEKDLKKILN